jgi:glycosyltransferase involved in cell wall biosynthesis
MDLVGDMLFESLAGEHSETITVEQVVPTWSRRLSRLPLVGNTKRAHNVDRVINRFSTFPRWLRAQRDRFDLFHIVDHSYAQLVHELPPERTIVTCHDLDAFRCLIEPAKASRPAWFRAMTQNTLKGFQQAAQVICVSEATRTELRRLGWLRDDRLSVIHSGVHPALTSNPSQESDIAFHRLLGDSPHPIYLLHVGSAVPRKRIDILLRIFARIVDEFPAVRLVKAGGMLDDSQQDLALRLGVLDRLIMAPDLDRSVLAALYRNAAVLLQTSDAEGFGLPVLEALACGSAVVSSDLPALREAGGTAAVYCPVGDIDTWCTSVATILRERVGSEAWERRRDAGRLHAATFSWVNTARQTIEVYRRVLRNAPPLDRPASIVI